MDITDTNSLPFARLWAGHYPETLEETQRFWDLRADEFNDITRSKDKQERYELINYLRERGALEKDSSVFDLGCGAGRHILEFAKCSKDVTGIDISSQMIAYAQDNVKESGFRNITLKALAWEDLDLDKTGYRHRFDLAFASMSPAIHTKETLLKFHESSRQFCFMSGFIYRTDTLKQRLASRLFDYNVKPHSGSIYYAFNVLWQEGIYADLLCKDTSWSKEWDVATSVQMYAEQLKDVAPDGMDVEGRLRQELQALAVDGRVCREVRAKTAWLFWHV